MEGERSPVKEKIIWKFLYWIEKKKIASMITKMRCQVYTVGYGLN